MKIPTSSRILIASVLLAACDVHVPVGPGSLETITVTPNVTLAIGATQQFIAVGTDHEGTVVSISPAWTIVAGGGAINATGLFTAGSTPGAYTATVMAASGGISGTANVTVIAGTLASITVTPNPDTLQINGTRQFAAVGRDAASNIVPVTPTWSVVASGGAVNATGLFTAGTVLGQFTNTVSAASGAISGTATVVVQAGPIVSIVVTPNPDTLLTNATQLFAAVARDAGNNVVTFTPTWSVVAGGGTIDLVGMFTAGAATGTFTNTVRAASGATFGFATVVVNAAVPPPLVPLGLAAFNGIMAGTAVTCSTAGTVNADVAISPGNTINGFGPCVITGVQHLADGVALAAQNDLTTAYNTLAGLPCPPANAIVADLGGTTKQPGVYCTASGIGVTGTLTLDGLGDPNANFVFQAGSDLIVAGNVVLIGSARPENVYWQVGTSATLGTGSLFQGNVITLQSITMVDDATLVRGRALARNGAVTLGARNTITLP